MESVKCILILLMPLIHGYTQASNTLEPFPIWPTTDEQESPDVYGNIVVWQQFVSEYGDYDIYVADMNQPEHSWRRKRPNESGHF